MWHQGSLAASCPAAFWDQERECVQTCSDGFYRDYLTRSCRQCQTPCLYCTNPHGRCVRCSSGYFLFSGICVQNCTSICDQYTSSVQDRLCKRGCDVANIRSHMFYSNLLQKTVSLITVTSHQPSHLSSAQYSVIYLLHDYDQSPSDYLKYNLHCFLQQRNILLVAVQGDGNFYVDGGENNLYQSYFLEEVVKYVERLYSVETESSKRALLGVGMGGYGALALGLSNASTFGVIATINS